MVRGRRMKSVFPNNEDGRPPNPKRKDRRVEISPKITRNMLNNNNKITQFFQSVGVNLGYDDDMKGLTDIIGGEKLLRGEIKEFGVLDVEEKSPATPHRIELHTDSSENVLDPNSTVPPPSEKMPPPKVKRRLQNEIEMGKSPNGFNKKLTDFFPVRRSVRKTKKTVLEEKQRFLEDSLRSENEDGLLVRTFEGKGRGVVTTKSFQKGDFVVEYSGELIDINEAKSRERHYAEDYSAGCYMYYFKHKNQQYCIDATAESGRLGRLVNHSRNGNLTTKTVSLDGKPRLVLIAKDDIDVGEEVTYDYGDRSKESLKHHPWLAS